jgi:hypothetical protein
MGGGSLSLFLLLAVSCRTDGKTQIDFATGVILSKLCLRVRPRFPVHLNRPSSGDAVLRDDDKSSKVSGYPSGR